MASPQREHRDQGRDDGDRGIGRLTWIAFILAFVLGLISIVTMRPTPIADDPPATSRSN